MHFLEERFSFVEETSPYYELYFQLYGKHSSQNHGLEGTSVQAGQPQQVALERVQRCCECLPRWGLHAHSG